MFTIDRSPNDFKLEIWHCYYKSMRLQNEIDLNKIFTKKYI